MEKLTQRQISRKIKLIQNNISLYVILIFPIIIVIVFHYIPIIGITIAFNDYDFMKGIFRSDYVGLKCSKKFLTDGKFVEIFLNTLKPSISSLIFSLP